MSYWVIKDKDGDYLLPPDEDGYAYCGSLHYAARFKTVEEAILQLKEYLEGDNCAYSIPDYYSYEEIEETKKPVATLPPTPTVEDRVAALEALHPQEATTPCTMSTGAAQAATAAYTLSELKGSVGWYCQIEGCQLPNFAKNGELWKLWELAYWEGYKFARERTNEALSEFEGL